MHKEEILQMITAFVIALVINIPITYAGLSHPRVYGEDNVRGYVKNENDLFTFEVRAKVGDMAVNPEQIRVGGNNYNSGIGFSSCTKDEVSGYYDCILENADLSDTRVCPSFTHDIKLYISGGSLVNTVQVQSVCDNTKPDITGFQTDKNVYSADDMIEFTININDKGDIAT